MCPCFSCDPLSGLLGGSQMEFPPEVLRMDGEKICVSGRIFKENKGKRAPTWYLRAGDRGVYHLQLRVERLQDRQYDHSHRQPFICLKGLLIREHSIPGLIIRIRISTE